MLPDLWSPLIVFHTGPKSKFTRKQIYKIQLFLLIFSTNLTDTQHEQYLMSNTFLNVTDPHLILPQNQDYMQISTNSTIFHSFSLNLEYPKQKNTSLTWIATQTQTHKHQSPQFCQKLNTEPKKKTLKLRTRKGVAREKKRSITRWFCWTKDERINMWKKEESGIFR